MTINNWYSGTGYRIEQFQTGGAMLGATDVQALVDAMDDHAVPPAGTVTLHEGYADVLEVIGSQWMSA